MAKQAGEGEKEEWEGRFFDNLEPDKVITINKIR
jgi:hypothetical protein